MEIKEGNVPNSLLTLQNSRNDAARKGDQILVFIPLILKIRDDLATQSAHEEWVEVLCQKSASVIAPKL